MDISYLGHSSFRLRGRTASLVTDPFDPKMVGLKYSGVEADIVTISHDHEDHNRSDLVKNVRRVVEGPGEYEICGVSIIGYQTFHDDKKGEARGRNTIYVIEMDELRIVHLGDLGHKLSDELVEQIADVDILMTPVGGIYTITPGIAAELVQLIGPKITIPMHFLTEGLNPEVFGKLAKVEGFLSEVGLTVERMEKLSVKKEDFGEELKVVVLERRQT